jgi:hypothetical protein
VTADELKAKLQARYGRTWRTDASKAGMNGRFFLTDGNLFE